MNPFELALGIVLIVFIYRLLDNHFKRSAEVKQSNPEEEDIMARVDAMEERIRVLEKIVTDDRYDLKREFKDLGS